jgi:hypothetical protein
MWRRQVTESQAEPRIEPNRSAAHCEIMVARFANLSTKSPSMVRRPSRHRDLTPQPLRTSPERLKEAIKHATRNADAVAGRK